MSKIVLTLVSLLFIPSCGQMLDLAEIEENRTEYVKDRIINNLDSLCSEQMCGRKTGTTADSLAFSFLCRKIVELGYDYEVQSFETEKGTTLRNIIVPVTGLVDSLVIIGSHYDGANLSTDTAHYPAAEDNGSGVVTNLSLLDSLIHNNILTKYSLRCCFWDSEEVFEGRAFRGSGHFTSNCTYLDNILFYINLDTIGHTHDNMGIVRSAGRRIYDVATLVLDKNDYSYVLREPYDGLFSDFVSFKNCGVEYLGFHDHYSITCSYPNHTPLDDVSHISVSKLYDIMGTVIFLVDNY